MLEFIILYLAFSFFNFFSIISWDVSTLNFSSSVSFLSTSNLVLLSLISWVNRSIREFVSAAPRWTMSRTFCSCFRIMSVKISFTSSTDMLALSVVHSCLSGLLGISIIALVSLFTRSSFFPCPSSPRFLSSNFNWFLFNVLIA